MEKIPMFLPGEPGGRLFGLLFGRIRPKWAGILVSYFVVLFLSIAAAMGIRNYAVHQLPAVRLESVTLVPVFERPREEIVLLYDELLADDRVRDFLAENPDVNLAYIMPGDFFLTALVTDHDRYFPNHVVERFPEVLEWHEHKFKGGLGKFFRIFYNFIGTLGGVGTDYDIERFIFVSVVDNGGRPVPGDR
ncbi:MAG TPA: hypothetical protein ENN06_12480, partial [Desulfobacteraceae bacterium]|nr:hypothetical protein [Desulfobacteraceae bacterium]